MKEQRSKIYIIVVVVLCIASISFSHFLPNIVVPFRNVFSSLIVPMQKSVNNIGMYFVHKTLLAEDYDNALRKIEELEKRVASLSEANNNLKSKGYEADRLRKLYDLSNEYDFYEKVGAHVISKDTDEWFQVFKIDKGSKDGIKVDMNVLSNEGLCGIVSSVGYNYSIVRSIIDDESRVSAMTQHSLETCLVEGDLKLYDKNLLRLTSMNINSAVVDGDKIVTSNISAKFLPNILIGYATDIAINDNQLTKSGYVIPVTDFSNLSEVLVITKLKSDSIKDN